MHQRGLFSENRNTSFVTRTVKIFSCFGKGQLSSTHITGICFKWWNGILSVIVRLVYWYAVSARSTELKNTDWFILVVRTIHSRIQTLTCQCMPWVHRSIFVICIVLVLISLTPKCNIRSCTFIRFMNRFSLGPLYFNFIWIPKYESIRSLDFQEVT